MIEYFTRDGRSDSAARKLVLVGREIMTVPFHDDVISLGFLDEGEKWEAIAACDWLVLPSPYESLSMALLEGWCLKKPALVNGDCEVLRAQCERSHGGLWYRSYEEWAAILDLIDDGIKQNLGEQGYRFATENYSWARVEQKYRDLLEANGAFS